MSETSKLVDAVVAASVAAELKRQGFKRHARTFVRRLEHVSHIINFQASQWNFEDQARFTINLGVYAVRVAERRGLISKGSYPKEYESTLRRRIGSLMPDRLDLWWLVSGTEGVHAASLDVSEKYECFGAPWLASMTTLEAVADGLRGHGDALLAASAALEVGRVEEARDLVAAAIESSNPSWVATVKRFALRNAIAITSR